MGKVIKIESFEIRIEPIKERPGRNNAELVGSDKDGNEYRLEHKVYIDGQYHNIETDIVCTDIKEE